MNHLAALGSECRWCDRGLSGGVGRLAGQAQHHGRWLLGRLRRQLKVGSHERVLRGHWGLDGRGHPYDWRLCGHTVAVGRRLQGEGMWQEAGLAHCCY